MLINSIHKASLLPQDRRLPQVEKLIDIYNQSITNQSLHRSHFRDTCFCSHQRSDVGRIPLDHRTIQPQPHMDRRSCPECRRGSKA